MSSTQSNGLIHAILLDGKGGGRLLSWDDVLLWNASMGPLWVHCDYTDDRVQDWVRNDSGLDKLTAEALLTEETRPRTTNIGDGLLIALRGINLNPGSEPDDMVSVRLWAEKDRVISTRKRHLMSVQDLMQKFIADKGPRGTAGIVVGLAGALVWRMSGTIDTYEDTINVLEDRILTDSNEDFRFDLAELRRHTISLRRYLSPQRDALARLIIENVSWLDDRHRRELREVSDRLIRHIEDIDEVRERAAVTHEQLLSRVSEQLNGRMYVLSVVAAIFLPLGFFTGLLGINVGGIPGAENPYAFLEFILILVVIVVLQIALFKWKKWL